MLRSGSPDASLEFPIRTLDRLDLGLRPPTAALGSSQAAQSLMTQTRSRVARYKFGLAVLNLVIPAGEGPSALNCPFNVKPSGHMVRVTARMKAPRVKGGVLWHHQPKGAETEWRQSTSNPPAPERSLSPRTEPQAPSRRRWPHVPLPRSPQEFWISFGSANVLITCLVAGLAVTQLPHVG